MPGIAIDTETCTGCERCAELCPANVLEMRDKKAVVANGTAGWAREGDEEPRKGDTESGDRIES